jgi:tankyrase
LHEAAAKGKIDVTLTLLQHGANQELRNSENKTPLDLADANTKPILTGEYRKDELLEAARLGDEQRLLELLNPLNVNCHASDGRRSTALHLASGYNRIRVVQILLQNGADVHAKDKGGLVPLHNSSSYGHLEVSQLLIKAGANVNSADLWSFTALHEAASKSRTEVCSLLISEGADIYFLNCHNKSPLDLAPKDLQERMINEHKGINLIDACRQCDITRVKKFLTSQSVNFVHPFTGDSALHAVASSVFSKRKQVLEMLIRKGAQLNIKNKDFVTPLHTATENSFYDVMDCLIKSGANVNCIDGLGQTCLHRAARDDDVQAVRLLLSHSIDPSIVSLQGYTAVQLAKENVLKILKDPPSDSVDLEIQLLEASKGGDLAQVKKIITSNPRIVNCRDIDGRHSTPLHFAAGYNRIALVEFLLQNGADVHASDKGGLVPLHNASSYGHLEVSQFLIKAGADVNATDLWKFSPLHEAAAKGKVEIVKLLLKNGANPNLKNRDGASPLDLAKDQEISDLLRGNAALLDAAKKGNLARVQRLLTPENINCRDTQGRNSTSLHLAAGYNNYEVAEYLLEQGADVNAQDKGGLIALHNASSYGHLEIAALLIKYNTQINAVDKW